MSNFDFRRDARGSPLWHAPLPNPDFDAGVVGASPFGVCQLCREPWPCPPTAGDTAPVGVSAIWLRGHPDGNLEVLAEVDGEWRVVIVSPWNDQISHIVEALGIRHAARATGQKTGEWSRPLTNVIASVLRGK